MLSMAMRRAAHGRVSACTARLGSQHFCSACCRQTWHRPTKCDCIGLHAGD